MSQTTCPEASQTHPVSIPRAADDCARRSNPNLASSLAGFFANKTQPATAASQVLTSSEFAASWRHAAAQIITGIVQMLGIPRNESSATRCRSVRHLDRESRGAVLWHVVLALFASLGLSSPATAQSSYGELAAERLDLASRAPQLSDEAAFGEKIGLYNGTTSFRYVDVSLPSNSSLPVEFARISGGEYNPNFWAWDVDVPKITTVMPVNWTGGWTPDPPDSVFNDNNVEFLRNAYWNGFRMRVDGSSEPLLFRGTDSRIPAGPPGKNFQFMTKGGWLLEVVPAVNGVGSSLKGYAPNGNIYYFDHLVVDFFDTVIHPFKMFTVTNGGSNFLVTSAFPETLPRNIYVLYVSRIEDRFGNWVNYEWAGPQLKRIYGNDGREIVITSFKVVPVELDNPNLPDLRYEVTKVSAGTRNWLYARTPTASQITNPDGSKWLFTGGVPGHESIRYHREDFVEGGSISASYEIATCVSAYDIEANQTRVYSVTSPSGLTASYRFEPVRFGRANMPYGCVERGGANEATNRNSRLPHYEDTWSLTSKTVSGPGIATVSTSYSYLGADITFDPADAASVAPAEVAQGPSERVVTVSRSDGQSQQYVFGRDYGINEGLLLEQHELNAQQQAIRSTISTWVAPTENASQSFALSYGSAGTGYSDQFSNYNIPRRSTVITQDDVTFRNEVNSFDAFVSPLSVTRSSSLGYSRTEVTDYHRDPALWVLGQVASVTDASTGKKIREITYNGSALPISFKSFGLVKQTLSYYPDGTVWTAGDGNGRVTTLANWMRGIPQSITFADGSTASAVVDSLGQIASVTNELGVTTSYTYDAMGRLASRSLPGWTPSSFSFVQENVSTEFGLPIGHWRHTETTGTYRKTTYFDGRFRPVMTREEDTANAATQRYVRRAFDHDSRETYVSYPAASDPGLGAGTSTSYDVLGRVTSTAQNDGAGMLTTRTTYLSGFQTQTTNPLNQSTTASYQAYDTPDTSAPVSVLGPDGVTTTIARDVFGMPLSVTRAGTYNGLPVSATRNYVYDGFERLCMRIEPESGATLFEYDGVGNLTGSAEGQPSNASCGALPAAARTNRSYDARNRLLSVSSPNAAPTLYSYYPDGALKTLTQGNSAWTYGYNNRGLVTNETLSFGDSYSFDYSYSALGHLSGMTYPSVPLSTNLSVDYAPNALGQPTRVGSFASGAQYFPDGSLKQFTYGNGVVHTVTQNGRHLPQQVRDAGAQVAQDFTYSYDANGNVLGIVDNESAHLQTRTLTYDARDRLVSASGVWGTAAYAYDPLDNLRLADQGSRQYRYLYDANNRLTQLTDPTGAALPGLDFAYDAQGRQIRKGSQIRTFDGANRITAIGGETYAYDGAGRRIATWAADGRTKVEVYTKSGQLGFAVDSAKGGGSSFVYLAGQRIAEDHWDCGTNTHTVSYYHSDALGSPVATTDATGNVLERTYYAPYGEALNRTVDGPGYTGHVMDAATGLVYAQQRYYDPLVGKFLSIDPVAADAGSGGNFNRYWYANDNPYKFTDPDGRCVPHCTIEQADRIVSHSANRLVGTVAATAAVGGGAAVAVAVGPAALPAATGSSASAPLALEAAGEASVAAQSAGATGGAATGLVTESGEVFTGLSTNAGGPGFATNGVVQEALDGVAIEVRSAFHGCCGEINALSNAANAGAKLEGAIMATVRAVGNQAGKVLEACPSCRAVAEKLGVTTVSPP